ncbi:hypothetical protein ACRALDRAFT_1067179 [Sodiomyces alcalophilus JCM 7366]|uniref:uncharacterized protein n=1 Tax=Sodiomyces alcalophilus JCM 7366 TaxID=591952 RepID=UPI0039B446C0
MAQKPLVIGGEASFISSTPPVVEENTIIIAAASPTVTAGHPQSDGWFLSDFYAFNYLLKGLGSSQLWLTAADPHELLQADGPSTEPYLHGNPYQDRKIVLSRDLLERGELTPVTVVQSTGMIDRFVSEVRAASVRAKQQNAPLLLLVFCHGLPNFTLLLDHEEEERGLIVERLAKTIEPGCRATLYSTACYSGGWVARNLTDPSHIPLNAAMRAAADSLGTSNAWQRSLSIGRYCGPVFASALIETLTSASSPLIDGPDGNDAGNTVTPTLQPEKPDAEQTMTYNAFCRSVLDICENRVRRLWPHQGFTFNAQDDKWADSWTGRTGTPLGHFEARWNELESIPYTGSADDKFNMGPQPGNPIIDHTTESRRNNHLETMARLFLQTCPDDWDNGWGPLVHGTLRRFIEGTQVGSGRYDIAALIAFRWELGQLADYMVEQFGLPRPGGQICIMWNRLEWRMRTRSIPGCEERYGRVWEQLQHGGLEPKPTRAQGPPFVRFSYYIAAAVTEANLPEDQTLSVVNDLLAFMQQLKQVHRVRYQERAVQDAEVLFRGENWLKSIGRHLRQSLRRSLTTSF